MKPGKVVFQGNTEKGLAVIIRHPKADDLFEMHQFINIISKEKTFVRNQGEEISIEEEKEFLEKVLSDMNSQLSYYLLAFRDNRLIGTSSITMRDKVNSHVGGFGLVIAKEFRNQGVGKLIMELVLKNAEANLPKLRIVRLGVFGNNPVAKALYESFGFKEYGRLPEGNFHRGKYVDDIMMFKKIK